MSLLGLFYKTDINDDVEKARSIPGAILLDVRTKQEYLERRIPGSINLPLDELENAAEKIGDKDTPVFVYCLSGGRSSRALRYLKSMGYRNVTDIGGISRYKGTTERGTAK